MLDIKFIRENIDIVKHAAQKKHVVVDLDRLLVVDDKRKELQQSYDAARAVQNEASNKIACASPEERMRLIDEVRTVNYGLQQSELKDVLKEWQLLMVQVPNVPDMSVPDGDDSANLEVRTWGTPPEFTSSRKIT